MKYHLLFTSLLVTSILVIYIISNKTENEISKIPEISLWKEHARLDNAELTPKSRPGLKNDETPFLSPADKLFKLYDGVETFVMFIGYARSRHSLVAAILDAHPEIIIPHEYDVIKHWEEYQSSILKQKNMQKYQLFFDLHQHSLKQAMLGVRADANYMVLNENTYTYHIPGLWQGGYERRIKVIGDKRGGRTSFLLAQNLSILEEISQVVDVPMKFIHVTRNPFDNIATMVLHNTRSRDIVREEDIKINNTEILERRIKLYFLLASSNQHVKERYGDAVLDIPGHETVLRPSETLQRLCDHLGVTCSEDYLKKCMKILYGAPSVTRNSVVWTEEQKERVTKIMKNYPFLKEYSFDKYPS